MRGDSGFVKDDSQHFKDSMVIEMVVYYY